MPFINSSKTLARPGSNEGSGDYPPDNSVLPVQILPVQTAANYQRVGARLSVGGVFLPITSYDESADSNAAGITVSVQLARISDREFLIADAEFLIETFCADNDEEIVWETVLTGKIGTRTLSVQNTDSKPADTLGITFSSIDKLSKSPARNLVIYDSVRADLDAAEFEPVYDTSGREYPLESISVADLSLYKLLDLICVTRCGFAEVITNLPDYPIRRADFSIFENYYDGLKPFIGIFDAIDSQSADGKFYLFDISLQLSEDAENVGVLPAAKIQNISHSADLDFISAFELQFSESETGEFFTVRNKTFETEVTTRFGDLISKTIRKVKYRQYRSNYARRIVLRETVEKEVVEIYGADSLFPASVSTETFEFDYLGRQTQSVKTVEKRVPDLTGSVSLRTLQTDELNHKYAVFPFAPRRQFLRRTEFSSDGLIAVDSDNQYFGEDFAQSYGDAHRTGNLNDVMTETSGPLRTQTEDFTPLPDGTVEVRTTMIDHTPEAVGRDAIVTASDGEPRAGDVSVSGAGRAGRIYVLAEGVTDLEDKRIEPFAVGELPLYYAVPLANRRLARQSKQKLSVAQVGWNKNIRPGVIFTASGRDNVQTSLITTGYRRFARMNNDSPEWGMSVEGEEI